jgi:hypothetical protein
MELNAKYHLMNGLNNLKRNSMDEYNDDDGSLIVVLILIIVLISIGIFYF